MKKFMQCINRFNGAVEIGWGDEALARGHDGFDLRNVDYVVQVVKTGTTVHFKPHGTNGPSSWCHLW